MKAASERSIETKHRPTRARNPSASSVSSVDLRELEFFKGLSAEQLQSVSRDTKISYFNAGEPLLRQGDLADRFYVILRGRVAIEREMGGAVLRIQELGPGETAGFSWSFTPEKLHFTARAIEPVSAVFIYASRLREIWHADPALGCELISRAGKVLIHRMEGLVETLRTLSRAQRA